MGRSGGCSAIFTYLLDALELGRAARGRLPLYCCYQFGKILENYWGTLRFNLLLLSGGPSDDRPRCPPDGISGDSLGPEPQQFLAVATIAPDLRVYLMFILPLKLKYLAWVYLGVTAWNVVQMLLSYSLLRLLADAACPAGELFPCSSARDFSQSVPGFVAAAAPQLPHHSRA